MPLKSVKEQNLSPNSFWFFLLIDTSRLFLIIMATGLVTIVGLYAIILVLAGRVNSSFLLEQWNLGPGPFKTLFLLGLIASILFGIFQAYIHTYKTTYVLTPTALRLKKGLLRREGINFSYQHIQRVDVVQGVIMQRFGLAYVYVELVGNSAIDIPGLDLTQAQQLRSDLLKRMKPAENLTQ